MEPTIKERLARLETKVDMILEQLGNSKQVAWKHVSTIIALLALLVSAFALSNCASIPKQPCDEACMPDYKNTNHPFPAVVAVVVEGRGLCTGAFVSPNVVMTAGHCVGTKDMYIVKDLFDKSPWTNKVTDIKVIPILDIALLRVTEPSKYCSPLASYKPKVGTNVTVVGYGQGKGARTPVGVLHWGKQAVTHVGTYEIQVKDKAGFDMPTPGDSGGPLYDNDGIVIGVTSYNVGDKLNPKEAYFMRTDKYYVTIIDRLIELEDMKDEDYR